MTTLRVLLVAVVLVLLTAALSRASLTAYDPHVQPIQTRDGVAFDPSTDRRADDEFFTALTAFPFSAFVAFWRCDEVSGTLTDSSGNGNGLSQVGGVARGSTGVPEGTRYCIFDGTDDNATCTDGTCPQLRLNTLAEYTLSAWYRVRAFEVSEPVFSHKATGTGWRFNNFVTAATWEHEDSGGLRSVSIVDAGVLDEWHYWGISARVSGGRMWTSSSATTGPTGWENNQAVIGGQIEFASATTILGGDGGTVFATFDIDALSIDNAAWGHSTHCTRCSCGRDGALCMGNGFGGYLFCLVDTDCRKGGNTTATCQSNRCVGRNEGTDIGCNGCNMNTSLEGVP